MDMIHVKTAIHKKMNKIEITDLTLPELQVYTSLNEAQLLHYYEPAPGIFIAESPKVIERALEFGCEPISLLMEQKDFDTCGKNIIAQCKNTPVYTAKLEVLEQITGYKLARESCVPCTALQCLRQRKSVKRQGASQCWKML